MRTTYSQTIKGNKATAASHRRQVKLLGQLAKSRRKGMKQLRKQYKNAQRRNTDVRKSVVRDLLSGHKTALAGYDRSTRDAESNLGTTASSSILNRAREGANAMAELSGMQAGESDRIKGMAASIRGMKANLDAGASDYASAITSVNNALGDLNASTKTNINNALREENASKAAAFGEYTTGLQQGYSDLIDLYGQQGAAYEQIADSLATKNSTTVSTGKKNIKTTQTDTTKYGGRGLNAIKNAQNSFDAAANAANNLANAQGNTFTQGIMSISQMNAGLAPNQQYKDAAMKKNRSNLDDLANAGTLRKLAAPEGSQLRRMQA